MEFLLKQNAVLDLILVFLLCFGVTLLGIYYPFYFAMPFAIIAPLGFCVLVILALIPSLQRKVFVFAKLFSLVALILLLPLPMLIYISPVVLRFLVCGILMLNIIEAVITAAKAKYYYNACSGLLLALVVPIFGVQWTGHYYLLISTALILWVIAYMLWNHIFVVVAYSKEVSLYYVPVLIVPVVMMIFMNCAGIWLAARVLSLLAGGLIHSTLGKAVIIPKLRYDWYDRAVAIMLNKKVQLFLFLVNLCLLGVFLYLQFVGT